jgi:hypothetical protein
MAYQHQPQVSRVCSTNNARGEIERRSRLGPSLRPKLPQSLTWVYRRAREDAAQESMLPHEVFPETCPWSLEQLLEGTFCRRGCLDDE